jgi:hypothetical protein
MHRYKIPEFFSSLLGLYGPHYFSCILCFKIDFFLGLIRLCLTDVLQETKMKNIRICFYFLALSLAMSASAQAQATRTWVSGVGDDANPCSRTAPCKTFAGAISKPAAEARLMPWTQAVSPDIVRGTCPVTALIRT